MKNTDKEDPNMAADSTVDAKNPLSASFVEVWGDPIPKPVVPGQHPDGEKTNGVSGKADNSTDGESATPKSASASRKLRELLSKLFSD